MKRNNLKIGSDINGVCDYQIEVLIAWYNDKYNDDVKFEDVSDHSVLNFLKKYDGDSQSLFEEFMTEDVIMNFKLREGAKELYNWVHDNGFELKFVTSVYPQLLGYTYNWLKSHFDWITYDNICRIPDKQAYDLDILIDDWEHNLIGGKWCSILLTQPYNKNINAKALGINRINSLIEAKDIIKEVAWWKGIKI